MSDLINSDLIKWQVELFISGEYSIDGVPCWIDALERDAVSEQIARAVMGKMQHNGATVRLVKIKREIVQ